MKSPVWDWLPLVTTSVPPKVILPLRLAEVKLLKRPISPFIKMALPLAVAYKFTVVALDDAAASMLLLIVKLLLANAVTLFVELLAMVIAPANDVVPLLDKVPLFNKTGISPILTLFRFKVPLLVTTTLA